jgi:hypothetical protein
MEVIILAVVIVQDDDGHRLVVGVDGSFLASIVGGTAKKTYAVTPNDSTNLPYYATLGSTAGLYVGVSGDVKVVTDGDTTITFTALAAGVFHPIAVKQVFATDTTATNIVACY